MIRARMKHLRAERICAPGAKNFWRDHGLDWPDFVKNGIEVEKLEATGDPFALAVAKRAREDQDGRQ